MRDHTLKESEGIEVSLLIKAILRAPLIAPDALPPASKESQGKMVRYKLNDKTEVLVCVQNKAGQYEWVKIGEST